jgi:predicted ATPase
VARRAALPENSRHTALALAQRSTLLVLDGLPPVPPVAEMIGRLLVAAAQLTVLVTSSLPLGIAPEVVVPIPPLAIPRANPRLPLDELARVPAVALFVDRAQVALPEFALTETTGRAITAISRRLDGHPMAIELAAARLHVLSLDDLAASIERDATNVLMATDPAPASGRHRGLQAAFEGAWASLPDLQQRVLARLAIFPVGSSADWLAFTTTSRIAGTPREVAEQ